VSQAGAGAGGSAGSAPAARPTLVAIYRPVFAVLLGCLWFELAIGLGMPLITVQLVGHQVGTGLIGIISSAYYVGFILGTLSCATIIDRVGHIRAFAVFSVLACSVFLLFALTLPPWPWLIWRAALGYVMAGIFVVVESWLNDRATPATRGRIFAAYQVTGWGAGGLAPLAMNMTDPMGPDLLMVAAMLFALAVIPMALTRAGSPDIGQRTRLGLRALYAASPVGFTVCFGAGLISSAFFGLLPVYADAVGRTTGELTIILFVATLGGFLVQVPAGYASDRLGRRPLILLALGVMAATAVAALVLPNQGLVALSLLAFAFSFGYGPLYALGVAQTNDRLTAKDFVAASGGLLCAWAVGASVGAAVCAQVMDVMGPQGLFVFEVAVIAIVALVTLYRMTRRPAPVRADGGGAA